MTEKERMDRELVYNPKDESITGDQFDRMEVLYDYNMTRPHQGELRAQLIQKMFAEAGEGCYFEPPLHSNFGCSHVHIGKHVYGNYGVTFVDDGDIYVGDYVMFGPRVTVVTAAHPVLPALRERALQFNRPVHIGRNVWVGAGAVILPGVTIGENSVIGAGSVVTKDIPANVVAVGVPCRVLREIGERDRKYYYKDRMFDFTVTEEGEIVFGEENK